ncbi:IS110 family transposase, partial [Streptomyces sp. NPDC059929]
RIRWDERTQKYLERRTAEGMSKREIIRCLKRYVARELYRHIHPRATNQVSSVA